MIYETEDLGQVLEGDRLVHTDYKIGFKSDVEYANLCNKTLNTNDLQDFREAVKRDYYYQVQNKD